MEEALGPGRDTSDQCTDGHLSHAGYRTVAAAEAPDESYQEQAARLRRRLGLDVVDAGKSNQCAAAVEYFGGLQRCCAVAGLPDCWDLLVDQVRANHCRKAGFICEFGTVVADVTPEAEPSFLEKARPPGSGGMISGSRRTRRAGVPASGIMVECPMMNCWNVSASSALADGRRRRSPAPSRCGPRLWRR